MNNSKKPRRRRSVFANALMQLLDDTKRFSRTEWAEVLGISTPAISQWVNDKTLPRPDLIIMMLDILKTRANETTIGIVEKFERLMNVPSERISPLGSRMAPNLHAYLDSRSFTQFGHQLRGLSPEEQVSLINSGAWSEKDTKKAVRFDDKKLGIRRNFGGRIVSDISSLMDEKSRTTDRKELRLINRLQFRSKLSQAGKEIEETSNRRVPVLPVSEERELESV